MNQYLLDTNICIYYLKGLHNLHQKIENIQLSNCYISEITIAELKFGVENSNSSRKQENRQVVENFIDSINILPIISCLDFYAIEKVRLRKNGTPIDEFDLLIGSSAVVNNLIVVTNNEKHFNKISRIEIENWTTDQT